MTEVKNFNFYKIIFEFKVFYQKVHEMRVMGVAIDSNNNHIISISKDKNICLTNYVEGKKFFGIFLKTHFNLFKFLKNAL